MYNTIVKQSEYTDGSPCWVAWHPELDLVVGREHIHRCLGQGNTIAEAQADLEDATIAFIEDLQAEGLPVPEPARQHPNLTILWSVDASRHMGATEQAVPVK